MPPRPLTTNETLARVIPRRWDYWQGAVSLYIGMNRDRFPDSLQAFADYKSSHERIVRDLIANRHATVDYLTQRDLDNPIHPKSYRSRGGRHARR